MDNRRSTVFLWAYVGKIWIDFSNVGSMSFSKGYLCSMVIQRWCNRSDEMPWK